MSGGRRSRGYSKLALIHRRLMGGGLWALFVMSALRASGLGPFGDKPYHPLGWAGGREAVRIVW